MSATRHFPLDEPATGPRRANPEGAPSLAATAASRWPVLARIAEVNRASQDTAAPTPAAQTTYRVDAPHAEVAPAQASSLHRAAAQEPPAHSANPVSASQQDRVLRAAPLPIRVALEAWQWIQPHQKAVRLAAMIALTSAGGMAMLMITSERHQPDGQTAAPAASAIDTAAIDSAAIDSAAIPQLETQHVELDRALVPAVGPATEVDGDLLEPTAAGPLRPTSTPLMAVEKEANLPTLPYPTTIRPEPLEPILAGDSLPQAQFDEPAVARLKGFVVESQVR